MAFADIRIKVRQLLGDFSISGEDIFTYENSKIFTLTESNIITVDNVLRNDTSSGVSYYYNSTTNKLTITSTLVANDTVTIQYTYYPNYSTTELTEYIQSALIYLSSNNYYDFEYDTTNAEIYPVPEIREENLIAIITSLIINPNNMTIRLPDLTLSMPNDDPLDVKIAKTISKFKKDSGGIWDILL